MSLVGVDVGTTGVKAVVFDQSGTMLAREYEEYALQFPFPGAAELDSKGVLAACRRVLAAAADRVKSTDPVKAIGIASQGEAFTPITADGELIGNIMTSSDSRAASLVKPWSDAFGTDRIYQITGHTPYPMYSLYKILWLKNECPDIWKRTSKLLFTQDLLAFALTGETKTDYSLAARSMLFDVKKRTWSTEILNELGMSVDMLPELVESGTVVGQILPEEANKLGLNPDVTISVCGHDQPVGALGCSGAGSGRAAYAIGTVECICPTLPSAILSEKLMNANLATYPHVLPNTYTTVAFNITGGSVLKWFRDNITIEEAEQARRDGVDPYNRIIDSASDTPSEVILLPHFGPTGTPHFDSHGAGVLFGMKLSTTRAEVVRSVLEGITYEMKWNMSILSEAGFRLTELRAIGGGANSDKWMQIKADILGLPITTMQVTESTCLGAAILAGAGNGIWNASEASEEFAKPLKSYEPNPDNASCYNDLFEIYREIYYSLGKARAMLSKL